MKVAKVSIIIFSFFGSSNPMETEKNLKEIPKDTFDYVDNSIIKQTQSNENNSNCDFDKFLKDPKTPKLAID